MAPVVMLSLSLLLLLPLASSALPRTPSNRAPSILYLMCDDLRPRLGGFGFNNTFTPNLDALSKRSLVFTRAYTQFPFCAPSRNSFMTGRRPDRTHVWNFIDHFRLVGANWTSMPEFFKENGYFTSAAGKLYHPGLPPNEDPPSWTDPVNWPGQDVNWTECGGSEPNYCTPTQNDTNTYDEYRIVNLGLARLQHALSLASPFWVGVGLHRPHWPWRMPQSFLDLQPPHDEIDPPAHPLPPINVPLVALNFGTELRDPDWGCYNCTVPEDRQRSYRRHYYAAISYADYKLGQVLQALEQSGRANETIIVFHSDHGYQLGEHNEWTKMTNFELAARVPLMMHVPWLPSSFGKKTDTIVELVDMYKTLANLTGLGDKVEQGVQGNSFASLLVDPASPPAQLQGFAQTQIPRCDCHIGKRQIEACNACFETDKTKFQYMGYSIRVPDWRYTAWVAWNGTSLKPLWDQVQARELYPHEGDMGTSFDDFENENVADQPQHAALVQQLHQQLQQAFSSDG